MKRVLGLLLSLLVASGAFAEDGGARKAFLPGVSGSLISTFGEGHLYQGFNFHYAFVEGISRSKTSYDFGGYYEWYSEIGFYKEASSSLTDDIFFTCATGVNLSFEKFLGGSRNIAVPYFGSKFGGVFFNRLSGGFFVEPILGLVILETPSVIINYDAGLFLNTVDLAGQIGVHHSLLINFNL